MKTFVIVLSAAVYIFLIHILAIYLQKNRGINYGKTVFWSVLFSPLIGYFIVILSRKSPPDKKP
ncbi:MAG: hypothetical protein JW894_10795 [Bacteroidales bacterium]|nr:hypothetical protein [Bacteroidales bacterium]